MNCENYLTSEEFRKNWSAYLRENELTIKSYKRAVYAKLKELLDENPYFFEDEGIEAIYPYFGQHMIKHGEKLVVNFNLEYFPSHLLDTTFYRAFLVRGKSRNFYDKTRKQFPRISGNRDVKKDLVDEIVDSSGIFVCPEAALYDLISQNLDYMAEDDCFIYMSALEIDKVSRIIEDDIDIVEYGYGIYNAKIHPDEVSLSLVASLSNDSSKRNDPFPEAIVVLLDESPDLLKFYMAPGKTDYHGTKRKQYFGEKNEIYLIKLMNLNFSEIINTQNFS